MKRAAIIALAVVEAVMNSNSAWSQNGPAPIVRLPARQAPAPRARDLGFPGSGKIGRFNAITDVPGVKVGHKTLFSDQGGGSVRTGVTVILPQDFGAGPGPAAAFFSLNGTGEMTGTHFIREYGAFFGPIALTGTLSVGTVRDSLVNLAEEKLPGLAFTRLLPVVAETYDGALNSNGRVGQSDVAEAIAVAASGPVAEGGVGGGTGMISFDFKAGIGTSSREVALASQTYHVGVLVQANFGSRKQLIVAGIPVGEEMTGILPPVRRKDRPKSRDGSIVVVIATDAPLSSRQLERIARRGALGMAKTGGIGETLSGDLFIAFSTGNRVDLMTDTSVRQQTLLSDLSMDPLFEATIQAVEEAIINSLVAGEKTTGHEGTVFGIPHPELKSLISRATAWRQKQSVAQQR